MKTNNTPTRGGKRYKPDGTVAGGRPSKPIKRIEIGFSIDPDLEPIFKALKTDQKNEVIKLGLNLIKVPIF